MGKTSIIHANVEIGEGTVIEDFCIIGSPPRGKKPGEVKTVIGKNCTIRSHSIIYAGNKIGNNFQGGNMLTLREHNDVGNQVSIGTKSDIQHHVTIEDDVRIHTQVFIPEFCTLKKGCWIGPNVVMTNASFPLSPLVKENLKGGIVEENAKVGANATIMPGIVIGKNAMVGSGSVVTKDVEPDMVVAGNPAKPMKKVSELKYKTGEKAYP
ncbi:MAG: transferase [Nanoarchaeota archaeon]|nr:transferase [Nanoarchaeota archaeon]